ncbi:hypothetical protein RYX36_018209 [Vicia faba]
MSAQSEGNYAEALQNYYEAMLRKLIPMIEALSTQIMENIQKLWNTIFGHSKETLSYLKLLTIWP